MTNEYAAIRLRRSCSRRLIVTPEQSAALDAQGHAARSMWNLLHAWWTWGGTNRRPSLKEADAAIRLGRAEVTWLADLPAQAAQQVLRAYFRAWRDCWEGRHQRPRFKARLGSRMAVDVPQARDLTVVRLSRRYGQVRLPKIGAVRFRWSGPIPGVGRTPGRMTGARVVKDTLGWHIVFRTEQDATAPDIRQGPAVGIDRGIAVALALSDGQIRQHRPWLGPKECERLLRCQRRAARQERARHTGQGREPSNRLRRTYEQIAALRAKAKRRRADWQHKITTDIAETYGTVVMEDLRVRSMTRSAKGARERPGTNVRAKAVLNRLLLDEGHSNTARLLMYKLAERGGQLLKVPAAYTSQTCSTCGHRDGASRNGVNFVCVSCGWSGHADTNASVNILNAAGLGRVRTRSPASLGCETSTIRCTA